MGLPLQNMLTADYPDSTQNFDPSKQPSFVCTWATRPPASGVPIGTLITVTDQGANGRSFWWSNGVNWIPVNGEISMSVQYGTLAAPIATITGNGTNQAAVLPIVPMLPAYMLIPGVRVKILVWARETLNGGNVSYFGPCLGSVQNPGGSIGANTMGNALPVGSSITGIGLVIGVITAANTLFTAAYSGSQSSPAGAGEAAIDLTVPNYVNLQVNNSLGAGNNILVLALAVSLEF